MLSRLLIRARVCIHLRRHRYRVWSTRRDAFVPACRPCRRRWAAA